MSIHYFNPLRVKIVNSPDEWLWSAWHCLLGNVNLPACLSTDALLTLFANNRGDVIQAYIVSIKEGVSSL